MMVAKLWRKCYEGLLVRSLLMKAYGFTNKSTWSISQGSVSNVCTQKDLGGIICILGSAPHFIVYCIVQNFDGGKF